jgi:hypothetical protein
MQNETLVRAARKNSKLSANRTHPFNVRLTSCGNPDYRQNPNRSLPGVPKMEAGADSLVECAMLVRAYINHYDLGGGNWSGGEIVSADGIVLGRVSYNGRLWAPDGSEIPQAGMKTVAECKRDGWR